MSQDEILSSVEEKLSHIDGLKAYRRLERETKDKVIVLEREAEESSIKNGLLRVANLGIFNALERQISMVLIFEAGSRLLDRAENLIQLKDQKGQLVGEWVNPEKARAMQGDKSVSFLSHDFVLYENVEIVGEPHFVMSDIDFPFLDGIKGIANVISGSPSVETDSFLRSIMGFESDGYLSHIIGFDMIIS